MGRMIILAFGCWILAMTVDRLLQRMLVADHNSGTAWGLAIWVGLVIIGIAIMPERKT